MRQANIGSVVEDVGSWNPHSVTNRAIAYVDLSSVDNKTKLIVEPTIIDSSEAPSRARQLVSTGDVLVSTVRPNLNAVAWVPPELDGATASTGFCVLRPRKGQVDNRYLFHWVRTRTFISEMERLATGASYPAVSDKIVRGSAIPIPPIEEQRRIASILDAADALRSKRRQALGRLDTLTQSIFLEMFGDPVANPKDWPNPLVDGALSMLTYGHRFYDESYSESGTPVVRITDLDDRGNLDFGAMPLMALSETDRLRFRLRAGDILFARSGATVGKVALIREKDPECIAGAYFVWMRFSENVHPEYARAVLTADTVRAEIAIKSRQAAQQNFSGPAIRRLPMPVPPRDLQLDFAGAVGHIEEQKARLVLASEDLDSLFASLQHRAFRGEL